MAFLSGGYSSQDQSGTSKTSGTSTTSRALTPYQTQLQSPVFSQIMQQLQDPSKTVEPFRVQARNQVNQNYTGLADSLRNQFFTTGGGASGKYGAATLQGDLARRGQLSDVDMNAQESAAGRQLSAATLGADLVSEPGLATTPSVVVGGQSVAGAAATSASSSLNQMIMMKAMFPDMFAKSGG